MQGARRRQYVDIVEEGNAAADPPGRNPEGRGDLGAYCCRSSLQYRHIAANDPPKSASHIASVAHVPTIETGSLPAAGADREPPAYLLDISRFLCGTRLEDLPPAVVERAKRLTADLFAIVTAGNQSEELQALARSRLMGVQGGRSWVIGTARHAPAREAGFLNGVASTWHDFDEGSTVAYSHPGSQTIPAAFAAAQELGVTGREFLVALVMGYEACARVGMASKMRVSVHPHGTTGTIGSAVAIARMKRFDEARMRQAINVAATMALTTNRQAMLDEATVRNFYSGHSAAAGAAAVELVEAGFTGQRDGIGFTYGTVIADGFDAQRYVQGIGRDWLILQGYFKLHPAGRYAHA